MFNENQIFYAVLWWVEKLPGGAMHTPMILNRYGRMPMSFPSYISKQAPDKVKPVIPPERIDKFFDHFFTSLWGNPKVGRTTDGRHLYFSLSAQSGKEALAVAGINDNLLPTDCSLTVHEDGQILCGMESLNYPGRPKLPYRTLALTPSDLDHCPTLIQETLCRIVPLQEGQIYKCGYTDSTGQRFVMEDKAYPGAALVVEHDHVEKLDDLRCLSDQEIIGFHSSLKRTFTDNAARYEPGYSDDIYEIRIEASDDPAIVRRLQLNVAFMAVSEPVQFGSGADFHVVQPGDFIIRFVPKGALQVVEKRAIDEGRARLILPPAPKSRLLN